MERLHKFYEYCDIQPAGTKTYLPIFNPTGINVRINTNIIETIYSEKLVIETLHKRDSNGKKDKNGKNSNKKAKDWNKK